MRLPDRPILLYTFRWGATLTLGPYGSAGTYRHTHYASPEVDIVVMAKVDLNVTLNAALYMPSQEFMSNLRDGYLLLIFV